MAPTALDPTALANLLAVLIPLGMKVYTEIQQAHSQELKPLDEILAAADSNWNKLGATAQAEIDKLNQG